MALSLKKIGLAKGPPKQDWYLNSSARPWKDNDEEEKPTELSETDQTKPKKSIRSQLGVSQESAESHIEVNRESIESQLAVNEEPIRSHIEVNQESIRSPTGSHIEVNQEPVQTDGIRSHIEVNQEPFRSQLGVRVSATESHAGADHGGEPFDRIKRLSAQQLMLFLFIVECCAARGELSTGTISSGVLTQTLQTTIKTIKGQLNRLIAKGLIHREKGKTGRGGFYSLRITPLVRSAATEYQRMAKRGELGVNWESIGSRAERVLPSSKPENWESYGSQLGVHPVVKTPSSSSNIIKTTTNSVSLSDEWSDLDISPLRNIGFSDSHVLQIINRGKLEAKQLQDSIDAFAFDIKRNGKKPFAGKTHLDLFMGIVGKGSVYAPPANYETPEEESLRKYVERQKEFAARRESLEREACELAFQAWVNGLSEDEQSEVMPAHTRVLSTPEFRMAALKTHFEQKIWPGRRREIALG